MYGGLNAPARSLAGHTRKHPAAKPLIPALTPPTHLQYSSSNLQIRQTHIAPHARYEAHSGIPRTGAGAGENPVYRDASPATLLVLQRGVSESHFIQFRFRDHEPSWPTRLIPWKLRRSIPASCAPSATTRERASCRSNSTTATRCNTAASARIPRAGSATPGQPGASIATTSKRNSLQRKFREVLLRGKTRWMIFQPEEIAMSTCIIS